MSNELVPGTMGVHSDSYGDDGDGACKWCGDRPRIVHCWEDYRSWLEANGQYMSEEWQQTWVEGNKTCMALDGHEGDHEWVSDSNIGVTFQE